MGAAVGIATSIAAPVVANVVGDIFKSAVGGGGAAGGAAGGGGLGGLFGPLGNALMNSFTSAFQGMAQQSGGPLGMMAPFAQPFSPGSMSPQAFNDPMSQLRNCDCLRDGGRGFDNIRDHRTGGDRDNRTTGDRENRTVPVRDRSSAGGGLDGLQADMEQAREALDKDPGNFQKQLDFQEKLLKLQTAFELQSTLLQTEAKLAKTAITNAKI